MKEPEILPILVYLFPIAFGFFGDPKQLGPTIVSTTEENPFRSQLAVSLLARLITAGYDVGKLIVIVQRRLAGDIHDLATTVFHQEMLRWDFDTRSTPLVWSTLSRHSTSGTSTSTPTSPSSIRNTGSRAYVERHT
ncbi:hypothetical protein N7449_011889 [Penicillium cf. viridicatum]|uniref:Uncharacterized protein n=1 Tax=Penicillium cf. viridicatum TaxID=2972119 RepID=A0A9W9IPT3_9EURO|nr:hypothetical protein N7449_011889 [Penicillium cf. viridicatum]